MAEVDLYQHIIVFSINLLGIILTVGILYGNNNVRLKQLYASLTIMMFGWVNFAHFARITDNPDQVMPFLRIAWFATPLYFLFIYFFSILLTEKNNKYKNLSYVMGLLGFGSAVAAGLTNLVVTDFEFTDGSLRIIYGDGMWPFLVTVTFLIVGSVIPLLNHLSGLDKKSRNRLSYYIYGLVVFYIANVIFNITLPILFTVTRYYYFGDYSTIILLGFLALAIVRNQFLDVRFLVGKVTYYLLISIFSLSLFIISFQLIELLFGDIFVTEVLLVAPTISIMIAITYNSFNEFLKTQINFRLINPDYTLSEEIQRIYREINQFVNDKEIIDQATNHLKRTVRPKFVSIFELDSNEDTIIQMTESTFDQNQIREIIVLMEKVWNVLGEDIIFYHLLENNILNGLVNYRSDEVLNLLSLMRDHDIRAIAKLSKNPEVHRVMLIGSKESDSIFTVDDQQFLYVLSNYLTSALEKSKLFEDIEKFNAALQEEVKQATYDLRVQNKDLGSLFNLTSRVFRSLSQAEVLQTAVDSIPQDETMVGAIIGLFDSRGQYYSLATASTNKILEKFKNSNAENWQKKIYINEKESQQLSTTQAIKQIKPIFTDNLSETFTLSQFQNNQSEIEQLLGIKSTATYPIVIRGSVMGIIVYLIKNHDSSEIGDTQKRLLQTYTTQIAIALENAKLYETSKEVQNELKNALKEVNDARRREQDMIDIMGHELRTPMTIIRNTFSTMDLQMKLHGEVPKDKQRKYIDVGLENSRRETNLIETMLSATKADSKGFQLTFEKVDLIDVIEDSMLAVDFTADKKGLDLLFQKPEEGIYIYCDRTRVQEISDNLIGNAVKYTPKGSVTIGIERDEEFATVHITDTGYGMSQEDLDNLGKKFYRAKNHGNEKEDGMKVIRPGGTGLGLYVSFALVKLMAGSYNVVSELGKGSVFSFSMPLFTGQDVFQVQKKLDDFERQDAE